MKYKTGVGCADDPPMYSIAHTCYSSVHSPLKNCCSLGATEKRVEKMHQIINYSVASPDYTENVVCGCVTGSTSGQI